jgi:hypothetical protein
MQVLDAVVEEDEDAGEEELSEECLFLRCLSR